ncbi:protein of unknown function [Rhodovastum atsumiense]|nr:protein of unknown function [Rhodovastum atsumiense]
MPRRGLPFCQCLREGAGSPARASKRAILPICADLAVMGRCIDPNVMVFTECIQKGKFRDLSKTTMAGRALKALPAICSKMR